MARSYFANVPISEPTPQGFNLDHDFGGIGWDQKKGMFIPTQNGELSQFTVPEYRPSDVGPYTNKAVSAQASTPIDQLLAAANNNGATYYQNQST